MSDRKELCNHHVPQVGHSVETFGDQSAVNRHFHQKLTASSTSQNGVHHVRKLRLGHERGAHKHGPVR